jgi:hypothetical protein
MPKKTTKLANTITSAASTIYWMYSVLMIASLKYATDTVPEIANTKKASGIDHKPSSNSNL